MQCLNGTGYSFIEQTAVSPGKALYIPACLWQDCREHFLVFFCASKRVKEKNKS